MRDYLCLIVNEDSNGNLLVQVHPVPENARESFRNLHGKTNDKPSRVTMISIDYAGGKASVRAKNLPVEDPPKDEQPDGVVLGKGPIWLDKEEKDGTGSTDTGDGKDE